MQLVQLHKSAKKIMITLDFAHFEYMTNFGMGGIYFKNKLKNLKFA